MKTYVLIVSRVFPTTHKCKGQRTYFEDKIMKRYSDFNNFLGWQKIHTIHANYPLWAKRIKKIQEGKAILSIQYWSSKPYNSKQVEICQLDKDSGIGIQPLIFPEKRLINAIVCGNEYPNPTWYKGINLFELSKNDGLSLEDFKEWFRKYDLSKSMGIIHFTNFRY